MKKIFLCLIFMQFSIALLAQTNMSHDTKTTPDASICMVTCNDSGTNNEIRWSYNLMPQAETIVIFILDKKGVFVEIGQQPAKDGLYVDNGQHAGNPKDSSFQYVIQALDKKGTPGKQSDPHQSIFIKGDQNGNFDWNAYEIAPKDASGKTEYHLWRQKPGEKATEVLSTPDLKATDPEFKQYQGTKTIWWVELGNFSCDGGKNGTKSNNSNE